MFEVIDAATVRGLTSALSAAPTPDDDAARVAEIRALEELKSAAEARQAALAACLTESKATAAEVALARRESHHRGKQHLALARTATRELPHTWAAWQSGRVSEWRVTLVARETACLTREHRLQIDTEIAEEPGHLEGLGDREIISFCRTRAASLDAAAVVKRRRWAESERRVTMRPAPDAMVHLSALLPVAEGVAAYAALVRAAEAARASADPRGKGQVMADSLVAALVRCGPERRRTPATVLNVVMTDRALFAGADDAAHVDGYGAVDAELARELAHADRVWVRRTFADPVSGELVAQDRRARVFPRGLRALVRLRDRTCRTPWCDAPVRHVDHVVPRRAGGPATLENAQGLCEGCNQAKETVGWNARPRPGPGHVVDATTPAGQRFTTGAPAPPGFRVRGSVAEISFRELAFAS